MFQNERSFFMAEELPSYQSELISINHLAEDYYELKIKVPTGFTWQAGQYMRLGLPTKTVTDKKQVRALSMAAPESDGVILLGTRTRQEMSSFKANLITLVPGEAVTVLGPLGNFTLPKLDHPLVMFASGVGITPIRALIKQALHDKHDQAIDLVFVANDYHLYQADFEAWAQTYPNLQLHLVNHRAEAQAELLKLTQKLGNEADYYISGASNVVDATEEFLTTEGEIATDHVKRDVLYGY